ncbi:MAG: ATP-dependent DNA ligase [Epsilonproteobacteria bacterium]|nr:ATP-dependent DNA ligase [Campylobacterota bacterium]
MSKQLKTSGSETIKAGGRNIEVSNTDKILFPKSKITKRDLINYYQDIAPFMLTHTKNRAMSMVRHPDGIKKEGFFQKNIDDYFPMWIKRIQVKKADGHNTMVVCNNSATLVYLANQACITPHLWLSKIDKLNFPDRMIFDLDPAKNMNFSVVCQTARALKDVIDSVGLVPFVMTTGSRGLHVVVPIKPTESFDVVRAYAGNIAQILVEQNPKQLTTEIRKNKRRGRLFIDCGRNAYAQTSVAPYAVRAIEGAPVAMPLHWEELKQSRLNAQRFTIKNAITHLEKHGNPWRAINRSACKIKPFL